MDVREVLVAVECGEGSGASSAAMMVRSGCRGRSIRLAAPVSMTVARPILGSKTSARCSGFCFRRARFRLRRWMIAAWHVAADVGNGAWVGRAGAADTGGRVIRC